MNGVDRRSFLKNPVGLRSKATVDKIGTFFCQGHFFVIPTHENRSRRLFVQLQYAFEIFNEQIPWTGFLGRIHFQGLEFSTSKFREGIEKGIYSGWDDEKLPTLASLRKRGYKAQSFLKLAEHIGLSEVDKTINSKDFFELLDNFNRD